MSEELNQVSEQVSPLEDGFDWSFEESDFLDQEDGAEENQEENQEVTEQSDPDKPFLTIKYNGADEGLSLEQAIELAQKGRNYDKLQERLNAAENNPLLKTLENLAQQNGLEPQAYLDNLGNFSRQAQVTQLAEKLAQQYPNSDAELLQSLAEQQVDQQMRLFNEQLQQQQVSAEQQERDRWASMVDALIKEYPDADLEHMPQEVFLDMKQGSTLLDAYRNLQQKKEIEDLKNQLSAQTVNNKNKQKAVGSLLSNGEGESDPFLSNFKL